MAAPTVYTEKTLADFMNFELGKVASLLGYTVGGSDPGSYTEAVNETLLQYGAATIAAASEIVKLRALARVQAWTMACNDLSTYYKFTSDGSSFDREVVYRQATLNLERVIALAAEWINSPASEVGITRIRLVNDPYV